MNDSHIDTIPAKLARYEALEAALAGFIAAEFPTPEARVQAVAESLTLARVQASVERLRSGADRTALEIESEGG